MNVRSSCSGFSFPLPHTPAMPPLTVRRFFPAAEILTVRRDSANSNGTRTGWNVSVSYRTLVRLAYDGDRLAAILNVRLSEDPFVRTYAGHIGYHVRPSCRKRGFGHACAEEAVRLCAEYGIHRPVICTSPENFASRKTAESAGFAFMGYETTDSGICVARYEIQ